MQVSKEVWGHLFGTIDTREKFRDYAVRNGPASWTGDRKQSTLWQIPAREGKGFEHGCVYRKPRRH